MGLKSPMLLRNTVERTTFSRLLPAALKIAERFLSTRSVWAETSPSSTCWVDGSIATCPETKTNPLARIACEYGPIACGASFVEITSRIHPPTIALGINRRMQMISNARNHAVCLNFGDLFIRKRSVVSVHSAALCNLRFCVYEVAKTLKRGER